MDTLRPLSRRCRGLSIFSFCIISSIFLAVGNQVPAWASIPDSTGTEEQARHWAFSLSGSYYVFPHDSDIPMIVGQANRDRLHLEARYNYEALRTGSVFVGWNLSGGDAFEFEVTPMAGAAFGSTTGLIPALRLSLGYGIADFYAETEYVYDLNDTEGDFFYSWLELGFTPADLFRAGVVAQRTRIVRTPLNIDRGIFAQLMNDRGSVSVYAFNLFTESWFLVFGISVELGG
jgi:hypothetical protein